ncbi:MAG: acyltransferase [Coriobacteriales bacterium]|nr:acyltransferase [Coriobacteriales bacterium]
MNALVKTLREGFPLEWISKHRNAIYGLCIVWIVFFHATAINKVYDLYYEPGFRWLYNIVGMGNVGVDIFLFLSGISLYYSFSKNPNTKQFYTKRLIRIVPAVWLIDGIYWFIRYVVLKGDMGNFLSRMSTMRFWITGDETIWFVSTIIVLYLLYPLIYRWLYCKPKGIIWRFVALLALTYGMIALVATCLPAWYDKVEVGLTRFPVFMMGCFAGKYVKECRHINWVFILLAVVCSCLFFVIIHMKVFTGMYKRFFYAFGGVSLTFTFTLFFELCTRITKNPDLGLIKFFTWVGGFSLELYLSHIMLNQVLRLQDFYVKGDFIQYAAMACCALVVAWTAKKIIDIVLKKHTLKLRQQTNEAHISVEQASSDVGKPTFVPQEPIPQEEPHDSRG